MTNEELKYFSNEKMQEKFREAIGDWQVGDKCHRLDTKTTGVYQGKYYQTFDKLSDIVAYEYCRVYLDNMDNCLRIPRPIDPVNPERGLWGMVDWGNWESAIVEDGRINLYKSPTMSITDTPTLALLKALAVQWGIEI